MASIDSSFCLQKIDSAIALVDRLLDGEHPHDDSKKALGQIRSVYEQDRDLLLSVDETISNDTLLEICRRSNVNLVRLKIFVGFLLRSTNIRNAFELYFPIRLLATELLGRASPVVLGSEWTFSPYTYPAALDELPDFIFIGIPASECQNPLILPLAGHELGHVVWRRKGAQQEFDDKVRFAVLDLYASNWEEFQQIFNVDASTPPAELQNNLSLQKIWARSYDLARVHLEELFCDTLGVFIFGASYLHSFRYLIAPSLGDVRLLAYPKIKVRVAYIHEYAVKLGLPKIDGFEDAFSEADPNFPRGEAFLLKMADEAVAVLKDSLDEMVEKYKGEAEKFTTGIDEEATASDCFRSLVPPATVGSIAAIVNAAWNVRLNLDDWQILTDQTDQSLRRAEKRRILTDLVLKSFEVYEFQKRTQNRAP